MDAVRAVHAAGIVHRDIKPTNVMVSATGPVLVDFGIAMGEGESHVTRTGLVMGTPGFIAPEIIEGTESDEITDWWSVSSVLAFAATGKPVFGTKPMMAVLEREASGNANLTGLPATTMTAFRAALNPDRSKRCTPEQLLQAITVDAFNPGAWQQYDDDAAQSGQTDVMRPLTIPVCATRVCYGARMSRPNQVRSRLQPSPRQECQGKPRCPAFGPLCSGSSDNRRPHRMRRFRRFRGSQTPAKPLTLHPPVFDGYHQSGQEQMPEPRTEPYRSGSTATGKYRVFSGTRQRPDGADVPPHPTYAADHAGRHRSDRIVAPTADIGSAHLHHAIRFHGQRRTNHAHATAADDGPTHGRCGHDRSNGRNRAVIIRRHRGNPGDG